jgi:large repetitive protein
VSNVSRAEGNSGTTPFQFTVSLTAPATSSVSVQYATASGTATSSTNGGKQDYQPTAGTLTFAPGQTSRTVTVNVIGDTRSEGNETFFLNLSNATNATIGDAQGLATILDDETRGKNWVGPASGGSWSTAANWSPSGAPANDSFVTIENASVTLSASATVSELWLKATATLPATLHVAGAGNRILRTTGLYLDAAAKLNLNDNDLIVDYTGGAGASPMTDIVANIVAGRAATPSGIFSTQANASDGLRALGVAEASDVLGIAGSQTATFSGQTVDATTVLVKFTYAGDANLTGTIDADDYASIDFHAPTAGAMGYSNGDFNLDGIIDSDDYALIDFNFNAQGDQL